MYHLVCLHWYSSVITLPATHKECEDIVCKCVILKRHLNANYIGGKNISALEKGVALHLLEDSLFQGLS